MELALLSSFRKKPTRLLLQPDIKGDVIARNQVA